MKIQANRLALASALVAAGLYVACWATVATLPDAAMALTEDMLHMQLPDVQWKMTPRSLVVGTVAWALLTGAAVWLVGTVYNRMSRGDGAASPPGQESVPYPRRPSS